MVILAYPSEVPMKEQYVGDVSDFRKYALLRALSAEGQARIGVCWMLTPPDGRSDGNKLAYLSRPNQHRHFDPELFDVLRQAASEPDQRRLAAIEESEAIPGATYFNEVLSNRAPERVAYMAACAASFSDVDLVFFDPDNGIEVRSIPVGRRNSSKYVYLDELRTFYEAGKSILVYQHFPRIERAAFVAGCVNRMRKIAPDADHWAFRTKHVVFLLAINPASGRQLVRNAERAAMKWPPSFMTGHRIASDAHAEPSAPQKQIARGSCEQSATSTSSTIWPPDR